MRILWVKAGKLLPVDTGGKMRSFNILKHLARWNNVSVLSYYAGAPDYQYHEELNRVFPGAIAISARLPGKASFRGGLDYIKGAFSSMPYAVSKHTAAEVREQVCRSLGSGSFDIAVCDFLAPADNFGFDSGIPVVLFEHNVEAILWQRQAAYQKNPFTRCMYRLEAAKMLRYERRAIRGFEHVIAVSESDGQWFRSVVGRSRVSVVPTGVDIRTYARDEAAKPNGNLIVFIGSMDWEANIDGVLHFCRSVLPRVRAQIPEARFRIVGRNPGRAIRGLASDAIEITGTVDSVIPHLREAGIVVVPLRIGGGTRLKILEAMAMGKAIVSTTIGAEGLDLTNGSEIVLADAESDFAGAVVMLMQNHDTRVRLEQNAALRAQHSGWENVAVAFQRVLVKVSNNRLAPGVRRSRPAECNPDANSPPLETAGRTAV